MLDYLVLIQHLKIGQNFSQLSQRDYTQKKGLAKCSNLFNITIAQSKFS